MGQGRGTTAQDRRYAAAARTFAPAIERLARGYEADAELRRDLVQEIHVALWRSFAYFAEQCSERSWVYRIAHNVAVTHLVTRRRHKLEPLVDLDELAAIHADDRPDEALADRQKTDWLLGAIHRLKAADRQALLLYLEGLTATETAEIVGLSPAAVAVRVHRLKALLTRKQETER